jgi:hypothetical protein
MVAAVTDAVLVRAGLEARERHRHREAGAGAGDVVNVPSEPTLPSPLAARRRKWYVLPGVSPVSGAETAKPSPDPGGPSVVVDPYASVVP